MSVRNAIIILTILCLVGIIAVPTASAQGMPHAIFGTVRDDSGATIAGATVTLRNERTGGVLSETTDLVGQYQTDIAAMSGGFQTGDVIIVKATSGNLEGSSSVTVSTLPIDQCNIDLSKKAELNPVVLGGITVGLIGLIILAVLYSRYSKETLEEQDPKKRHRNE